MLQDARVLPAVLRQADTHGLQGSGCSPRGGIGWGVQVTAYVHQLHRDTWAEKDWLMYLLPCGISALNTICMMLTIPRKAVWLACLPLNPDLVSKEP
jgi:hypothetical protein